MYASSLTYTLLSFMFTSLTASFHLHHDSRAPEAAAALKLPLDAELVHDFPDDTWIENLAIRENGYIIATEDTHPRIYLVDPSNPVKAIIIHEFTDTASILGIVETAPDVFHVCSANYSSAALQGYGEAYIYRLDMRNFSSEISGSAKVSMIASLPRAGVLDGLTFLGGQSSMLLVSDFLNGVIWSVNFTNGEVALPINSTFTRSTGFGVNGLKVFNNHLYFTNSQQQSLVKVEINAKGEAIGDFNVLSRGVFEGDDFAIDRLGNCYVTSFTVGKNGVWFVPRSGSPAKFIAEMAGPTGAAFGRTLRDRNTLYVSTSGGDYEYGAGKNVTVSGKILKLDVGSLIL